MSRERSAGAGSEHQSFQFHLFLVSVQRRSDDSNKNAKKNERTSRVSSALFPSGFNIFYLFGCWLGLKFSSLFVHRLHRLHGSNSGFPLTPRKILERRRPLYIQFRGPSEFMVEFYKNKNRRRFFIFVYSSRRQIGVPEAE